MKQNIDAEMLYEEFAKKMFKCKGVFNDCVNVICEYSDKILSMKYAPISYKFASCVSKLNSDGLMNQEQYDLIIKSHGNVVIKYGDSECNYWFISFVKGADIEKHREVIRENGDLRLDSAFEKNSKVKTKVKKLG